MECKKVYSLIIVVISFSPLTFGVWPIKTYIDVPVIDGTYILLEKWKSLNKLLLGRYNIIIYNNFFLELNFFFFYLFSSYYFFKMIHKSQVIKGYKNSIRFIASHN